MIYAQFYQLVSENVVEGVAIFVLDGRHSHYRMGEIATRQCKQRGYAAWRIFSDHKPISQLWFVNDDTPVVDPVWLSAHGM